MPTSKYLSATQLRGLRKAGDVIAPGFEEMPRFSDTGALDEVDRQFAYMAASDLKGIKALLSVFAYLPSFLIHAFLWLTEQHAYIPGPLAAPFRMANIGVKGVIMTLYYSDFTEGGPSILRMIRWDTHVVVRD